QHDIDHWRDVDVRAGRGELHDGLERGVIENLSLGDGSHIEPRWLKHDKEVTCSAPFVALLDPLLRHRRHHPHSGPPRDYHCLLDYAKRYRRVCFEMEHAILCPFGIQAP